jgi:phosphoinositide-3-kinase regulatory subunit 4
MEISTRFRHPLEHGVITAINPDKHWLVLGTELGILSLWDLRFGLLLKSWRASGAVSALSTHPSKGRGLWLVVGVERKVDDSPIIEVYNIETSKLVEVYEVRSTRPSGAKSVPPQETRESILDKAGLIAEIASGESALSSSAETDRLPPSSVLSLAVGQRLTSMTGKEEKGGLLTSVPESKSVSHANPGYMITAGEDRVVRYWDLAKPGEGMVICGSPKEKDVVFK